jgi:hypothetical protein
MIDIMNLPFPHPRPLPSGDDIRRSKSIIEQLDRNIEDLEQDIRQLQTRLQEVQQKRTNYASYISSLRRLPVEILTEIISMCLQNDVEITVVAGICSRLREVVLGMTGIWSDISIRANYPIPSSRFDKCYGYSTIASYRYELVEDVLTYLQHNMQCTTTEQLVLVLLRAGSAPLKLSVSFPVEMGTLELISSQNIPIHSLAVINDPNTPLTISRFRNLNLSQLQKLRLAGLPWNHSRGLMDLALQSSSRNMTFHLNGQLPTPDLFRHELIQRVVNMGISTGQ